MADLVTVTECRDCDWPHGKTPSQAAANRHAKETGHTVVTEAKPADVRTCYCGTTATAVPRVFPHPDCDGSAPRMPRRDLRAGQDHAEFAGWMEAQGWYWTGTAYTRDDMAEAFLAGMQAARDLAEVTR